MSSDNMATTDMSTVINIENPEKNENHGQRLEKHEFLVMLGLSLSVFLAVLDRTIVSTALPAIASDFNTPGKIAWVATFYLITSTGFQPAYGRLSDIFGRKATFLFAIIIFEIGSLLCGVAPNMTVMIIARAIAGIGGGGIISLVIIIISDIVPLQDNGKYQGMIGAIFSIACVAGSLVGGAFTDHASWRWSFYINLPLGAVIIAVIIFLLHVPRPKGSLPQKLKRVDYAGTLFVVGSNMIILLALSWGGSEYKWTSPVIAILFSVGNLGYLIFSLIEAKFASEPAVPPYLLRNLNIVGNHATNLFQGMIFFGLIYYLPLYFQVTKGDSVIGSGLRLIPYILGVVVASIVTGQIVSRTNVLSYRMISVVGAALTAIGIGMITLWDENTGRAAQIGYMVIAGVGLGTIMNMPLLRAQEIIEYKDFAAFTTLLMFFRLIGAVLGIALFGAVFSIALNYNFNKASIAPEYLLAVEQSVTIINQFPEEIRNSIIIAYVKSLRFAFIAHIPFSILCIITSILMGNGKSKISNGNETIALNK